MRLEHWVLASRDLQNLQAEAAMKASLATGPIV